MASFFKKKRGVEEEGGAAGEAGAPPASATGEASDTAGDESARSPGRRGLKKKEKPAKKERPPRKPLFSRKKERKPAAAAGEPPAAAGAETPEAAAPKGEKRRRKGAAGKKAPGRKSRGAGGTGRPPIGLDLDRSSITAVRLRHRPEGTSLDSVALDRLPEGVIQEGEVRDVEGLGAALRSFWKSHDIKGRKVAIGLANQKIVVRTLEFPMLDESELRSAIEFQAQDYIPIPIEEAVIDFHVMGSYRDENEIEKQKVLVVAAQKEMVMDFVEALKKARLSIVNIDLQAFALSRALTVKSFLEEGVRSEQAVAMVNIAADVTNVLVDAGGEPLFTRIISFGGNDFTRAVQEQLSMSFEEAELMKAKVGLAGAGEPAPEPAVAPLPPAPPQPAGEEPTVSLPPPGGEQEPGAGEAPEPPSGQPGAEGGPPRKIWDEAPEGGHADPESMARRALEIAADSFGDEVRRSLDYYLSQDESVPLGKLVLSGRGSMLRNLSAYLGQMFPYEVEMGNPLNRITENNSGISEDELKALAPHLSIAIGLALEEES